MFEKFVDWLDDHWSDGEGSSFRFLFFEKGIPLSVRIANLITDDAVRCLWVFVNMDICQLEDEMERYELDERTKKYVRKRTDKIHKTLNEFIGEWSKN